MDQSLSTSSMQKSSKSNSGAICTWNIPYEVKQWLRIEFTVKPPDENSQKLWPSILMHNFLTGKPSAEEV